MMESTGKFQPNGKNIKTVSSVLQPSIVCKKKQLTTLIVLLVFVGVMIVATSTLTVWSGKYNDIDQSDLKYQDDPEEKNDISTGRNSREKRSLETDADGTSSGGATYIRWGRTSCPDDSYTELVYAGAAGGSYYSHEGSASNLLCLPMDPIWNKYNDASATNKAIMYGTEYLDESLIGHQNAEHLLNHDVPCAVCRSLLRTSSVMIPARTACYKGWHLEYQGYLMAGHYANKGASEYVCVDDSPEAESRGYQQYGGVWLYHVEASCGSLPCPPYVNGRELTCSVCTK